MEESFEPGETVSSVARRNGVAPNLLFRWRKLMSEGGAIAVSRDARGDFDFNRDDLLRLDQHSRRCRTA